VDGGAQVESDREGLAGWREGSRQLCASRREVIHSAYLAL
jgi:hypothetical protein